LGGLQHERLIENCLRNPIDDLDAAESAPHQLRYGLLKDKLIRSNHVPLKEEKPQHFLHGSKVLEDRQVLTVFVLQANNLITKRSRNVMTSDK
jgi:hypothetical protein